MTKIQEINLVNEFIDTCNSIDQMGLATKLVDNLEKSQPNEKAIIYEMRQQVCDLTFKFYFERYPINLN